MFKLFYMVSLRVSNFFYFHRYFYKCLSLKRRFCCYFFLINNSNSKFIDVLLKFLLKVRYKITFHLMLAPKLYLYLNKIVVCCLKLVFKSLTSNL